MKGFYPFHQMPQVKSDVFYVTHLLHAFTECVKEVILNEIGKF